MIRFTIFIAVLTYLCKESLANNVTKNLSPNVINLDTSSKGRGTSCNYRPQFYYTKQTDRVFDFTSVVPGFVKIPGLSLVFYHAQPRLYKIRAQGNYNTMGIHHLSFLRIMIDGKILIYNKLYPNNAQRAAASIIGELYHADMEGGIFVYPFDGGYIASFTKEETVYLAGGVHSIDVVLRTEKGIRIEGANLFVELAELDQAEDINLPILKDAF